MKECILQIGTTPVRVVSLNTAVVGSGAAGLNAADSLFGLGQKDIALVTEHMNAGTSRNTGSDKQTYYKLTLSGGDPDSVREMAETLFEGQCVDGDHALCEAALSAQCFLKLVGLGVPFPRSRYGEYIGYKTDHDPRRRATSVGPYTSRCMTECLEKSVREKGIQIFDRMQVVRILSDEERAYGLLCLNLATKDGEPRFTAFNCENILYCTGGPAGIYADSVYPFGHYGATGLAFEAGVLGKNLTEWQYGLASVKPRWNVSGTYMQVLPKFISTGPNGENPHEFLFDSLTDKSDVLSKVFLKGYQWPFDVRKVADGSSIIDILVYLEQQKGRRVFLDFRENPCGEAIDFNSLSPEARGYLEQAGACFGTPIERLRHMNLPAVEFYLGRGVDLAVEPLEIALCAQHNNGGLSTDCWWQTNLSGFFAAGEVCASHGVYRPGGSALNAGQVGSLRAAQYIAARRTGDPMDPDAFAQAVCDGVAAAASFMQAVVNSEEDNVQQFWNEAAQKMSSVGASMRSAQAIRAAAESVQNQLGNLPEMARTTNLSGLAKAFRLRDILICQQVYLESMADYAAHGGRSRGSALYTDPEGTKPYPWLPDLFSFTVDKGELSKQIQEVAYQNGTCRFVWRGVRPIPEDDDFFENVWRNFRENQNVY